MAKNIKPTYDESLHSGGQFADDQLYADKKSSYRTTRDEYNNELVEGGGFHSENATAGEGAFDRFNACDDPVYDRVMKSCNVIEYSADDVTPTAERISVDVSRADRGRES